MKTVLPQNTGAIEWGGVAPAVLIAIGLVVLFSFCLLGYDCWRIMNRKPGARPAPCEEDRKLDALARDVDRELDRRRSRPVRMRAFQ